MKTVLIVEDDAELRFLYSEIFQFEDYEVLLAKSGSEALQHFQSQAVHLMVLDLSLSQDQAMGSEALFKAIRDTPQGKQLPILIISGWHDGEKTANEWGAQGFLQKPIDLEKLIHLSKNLSLS